MFDDYPFIPYVGFKDENVRTPITLFHNIRMYNQEWNMK